MSRCSFNNGALLYVEVSGQLARLGPRGLDFLRFRPSLDYDLLQAQLIQNLWNFLELNRICMKHSAKAYFIPKKLMVRT